MNRTLRVSLLLFASGFCALIYQTTWLREFRLIFGASTAASAAVLAIFMGGLGAGSLILGKRADRHPSPLLFYAHLELLIALFTALTPLLLMGIRELYIWAGGTPTLGIFAGTLIRLVLAALVIGTPTFLMGGTLPAAARAVEAETDLRRKRVAWLYGLNTLGAVTGAFASTFFLLEMFGNRRTLWIACLLNVLVALTARSMAMRATTSESDQSTPEIEAAQTVSLVPPKLVYAAAAMVGFVFLLMELVWYRMLSPLLGGTSFTFGLILAVALLGIGLGGACYSALAASRPATVSGFALTCALEALFVAIPLAMGDRIAMLAILLRPLGSFGFEGFVLGWSAVTALVILPAAFVAGIQFPLLIGLLGQGRADVGRHVGLAYAWNTAGAVAGSLAGGFGLLPILTAPGTWRAAVILLVIIGASAVISSLRNRAESRPSMAIVVVIAIAVLLVILPAGPTAAWRHSPIGAGRADNFDLSVNELIDWERYQRRSIVWEAEGIESSVGLSGTDGLAFVVNGKIDGNTRGDAGTQVMSGLIGGILHPNPRTAMVIGLGTGTTAGWLGAIPSMERVDVVELEPAILEVARRSSPVNHNVMNNPKVRTSIGDAREVLLASKKTYDLIFSEPSNPYRAGIANLYTREFYEGVAKRLNPGGIFLHWAQVYEIDRETVGTIYATLLTVFPHVDSFQTQEGDLLLLGSMTPVPYDFDVLRRRIASEPFREALNVTWRVDSAEGFMAHYIARTSFAKAAGQDAELNTDDRTVVEFAFARQLGTSASVDAREMRRLAQARNERRPELTRGAIDWSQVERESLYADPEDYVETPLGTAASVDRNVKITPLLLAHYAEALADSAHPEALAYITSLQNVNAAEADIILARLRWREGLLDEAVAALESGYRRYRTDPWPLRPIMKRGMEVAIGIAAQDKPELTRRVYGALREPFSARMLNEDRIEALEVIARKLEQPQCGPLSIESLGRWEPHTPWNQALLQRRRDCYRAKSHPLAAIAEEELNQFFDSEPLPFGAGFSIP